MSSLLSQNFFELFGLVPGFSIDQSKLAGQYRHLQQLVHPDRFATASEAERRHSMQLTAHINEAYQTLKQPLSRARYLLELRGVVTDQSSSLDNAFLMEQMELREQLAELPQQSGALAELMNMRNDLSERLNLLEQTFAANLTDDNNEQALCTFNKMQFYFRLLDEISQMQERFASEINQEL